MPAEVPLNELVEEYPADAAEIALLERALAHDPPPARQHASHAARLRVLNVVLLAVLAFIVLSVRPTRQLLRHVPAGPARLCVAVVAFAVLVWLGSLLVW